MKRLDAVLETHLDSALARLRLSRRQWQVLHTLSSGPITPAELAEVLRPSARPTEVTARNGTWLRWFAGRLCFLLDDRLTLTGTGSALHAEAAGIIEASRRGLTAGIGVDEYAMAVSVLECMTNNADRLAAE